MESVSSFVKINLRLQASTLGIYYSMTMACWEYFRHNVCLFIELVWCIKGLIINVQWSLMQIYYKHLRGLICLLSTGHVYMKV